MKNLLKLFLLLLSLQLNAQTVKIEIPKGTYDAVLKVLQDANVVAPIPDPDPVKPVDPVVPGLVGCEKPIKIIGITNSTPTSSLVEWHSENVFKLRASVFYADGKPAHSQDIKPNSGLLSLSYQNPLPAGSYYLTLTGLSCTGSSPPFNFTIQGNTGGVVDPIKPTPVDPSEPTYTWKPGTESQPVGVYSKTVNGVEYHFNKTPLFEISITENGITDVTPGIDRTGAINKLNGKNVFYAIGYFPLENADGSHNRLYNLNLPDNSIVTLRQFVCDAGRIPDFKTFKDKFNGWGDNGVNSDNAVLSEIFLSIQSGKMGANSTVPAWLKTSRTLTWPSVAVEKDWYPYGKHIAIGHRNQTDDRAKYIRLGAQPYVNIGQGAQPGTFDTYRMSDATVKTEGFYYNMGVNAMAALGNSPRSYLSSEIAENSQNTDRDIYGKVASFYTAAFDKKGTKNGSWGDYGGDQYYGFIKPEEMLYVSRKRYEESLTTKLYNSYSINGFGGISEFYTRGHYKVRGVNLKYYLWNHASDFVAELAYARNRVKLATMTYGDENNEAGISLFTFTKTESFVMSGNRHVAIENTKTGEIIPFPGGEIRTNHMQVPAPWDEEFTLALWSHILLSGSAMWDAPNSTLGGDQTKLHFWGGETKPAKFRKAGSSVWEEYKAGQNGAPESSHLGMMHSLYAAPQDAALAAQEFLWPLRNRLKNVKYAEYTSSRGSFKPTPGTAGLHLNGGNLPINRNLFVERDIWEQKKGFAVECWDDGGVVIFYRNNYLAPHEYEDDVTVNGHNLGRVYGRQTAFKIL